jgi:hypothetical protein
MLLECLSAEGGRQGGPFIAVAPSLQKYAKNWLTVDAPDLPDAPSNRVHVPLVWNLIGCYLI